MLYVHIAHLVVHGTSGSTSYETIPTVRLETSGGVLLTVDMVVQWRDGRHWLCDHDDDDDDECCVQGIIHKGSVSADMAHQLYVLQCQLFALINEKRHTPVDPSDQVHAASYTPYTCMQLCLVIVVMHPVLHTRACNSASWLL